MNHSVRIWDLPTRLFHWTLFLCVLGLVVTAQLGGSWMTWHSRLGYCVFALLLFRLVWGLVGGRWSRFASFIYAPSTIINHLQGLTRPEHSAGHSPLGAGSVFAMLFFLMAQVGTGLFSDDDIAFSGPLTKFVSNAWVGRATFYHKEVGAWVLIVLVLLHVAAIVYYLRKKKENLIRPMVYGDKTLPVALESSRDDLASRLSALAVLGVCAGVVAWVVSLGS
jgi:cytochrome b